MNDLEVARMADGAAEEIEQLRRKVAELQPRADAYTAIATILGLLPRPSQGYGLDIAWELRKIAASLRESMVEIDPCPPVPADETHGDMA